MARAIAEVGYGEAVTICRSCGNVIGYRRADIKKSKSYDWTGDWDYIYSIVCPSCSEKISVKEIH